MSEPHTSTGPARTIDDIFTRVEAFSEEEALAVVRRLARAVGVMHAAGKLHRAIVVGVTLDSAGDAQLQAPPVSVSLGGTVADLATCPPELHGITTLTVPVELDEAHNALQKQGISADPRRIDVYQLGVVLCQLVTGRPIGSYLQSPRVKADLSPRIRQLVDGALGYDRSKQYSSTEELIAAIEVCMDTRVRDQDTDILTSAPGHDTETSSEQLAAEQSELPFVKLGHYEILERIGQGGMGDVYKGYERSLNRVVAIKVLPPDFARHPEFLERFKAEATAVASITHPNVIQIHYIGEDAGHRFFAMQYVDGESLAELLHRQGRLQVREALAVIEQVLAGLSAAHHLGIIHRDIKPGNVLIDRKNGRALVADFGLVKSLASGDKLTATGVVMGTVDYISPEQGRGHVVDTRSDLYSVGALAYQLLSGQLPFEADSPTAMIFQHVYEEPAPLTKQCPDLPEQLAAVVHRLLEKSPEDRFQSAEDALVAIRAAASGASDISRPISASGRRVPGAATAIIAAPQFVEPTPLPLELERFAPLSWWAQKQEQFWDALRRRSPDFVKQLQNTQHQVDGAVAEYEERRNRLQALVDEADDVLTELRAQAAATRDAARDAADRADAAMDGEEVSLLRIEESQLAEAGASLEAQVAEQEQEMETMRLRLAQVNATLARLRSQRDLLNARLKVAQVQAGLDVRKPKRRLAITIGWLVGIAGTVAAVFLLATFFAPSQGYFPRDIDPTSESIPTLPQSSAGEFGQSVMKIEGEPTAVAIGDGYAVVGQAGGKVAMLSWYPNGQLHWGSEVVTGLDPIARIATSRSNELFAVAAGKSIQLWSRSGGKERRETRLLQGHTAPVTDVVWSPDGKLLLSASNDGSLITWDAARGIEVNRSDASAQPHSWVQAIAWTKDGSRVLLGARVGGADSMGLWSYFDERNEHVFDTGKQLTHAVAFSPMEDLAYSFSSSSIQVRDVASGKTLREFGSGIVAAAFAPSAQRAWTADNRGRVALWDTRDGSVIESFDAHKESVRSVTISADGARAVSISRDGEIHAWVLPAVPPPKGQMAIVSMRYPVVATAIFPDARQAITNTSRDVALWDLGGNRQLREYGLKARVTSLALSKSGDRFIYGTAAEGGKAIVGVRRTSNELLRDDIQFAGHETDISAVALSADGLIAASSSTDGIVRSWDAQSGALQGQVDIGVAVDSVVLNRFGSEVFIAAEDGIVRQWKWQETEAPNQWSGHSSAVRTLALSRDEKRMASASDDGTIIIWNVATGNKVGTLSGQVGRLNSVAISMHGMAVLAGDNLGTVRLWDVTEEKELQQFVGHSGRIISVRFSLDGSNAISSSDDGTLRVWKLPLIIQ